MSVSERAAVDLDAIEARALAARHRQCPPGWYASAAMDPETLLALIERIRELEARLSAVELVRAHYAGTEVGTVIGAALDGEP